MKILSILFVSAALAGSLSAQNAAQQGAQPPKTNLKVGDMAPDFTLLSTAGKPVTLSDFRGKSAVVLAFFPAAFTGGCTKEMLAYQASLAKLEGVETPVFGISADNTPSQKAFAEKLSLTFPLLSDFAKRQVAADYGVLIADRGLANRATFVIDKDGRIQHIEEGAGAIDPTGAEMACARIHGKKTE
jgi:peroxiredoxin